MAFALLCPCAARWSIRDFFTDTSAISERAKNPFNNVSIKMISNSNVYVFSQIYLIIPIAYNSATYKAQAGLSQQVNKDSHNRVSTGPQQGAYRGLTGPCPCDPPAYSLYALCPGLVIPAPPVKIC